MRRFKLQITIDDPELSSTMKRLGPYRRAIFTREAVRKYAGTEDGRKLIAYLLERKRVPTREGINLDEILS